MNKNVYLAILLTLCTGLASGEEKKASVPVTVKPLESLQIDPLHSAPATVISLNHSQLSAQISARIEQIVVQVGQQVKQGDKLVQLDCSDSKLAEQDAKARQTLARKELKRAKSLRRSNSLPETDFNKAETELIQANVVIKQTRLQVQRCEITAPFNGVVTDRQASEGELATAGTPILRLLDTQRLEVSAQVPAKQSANMASATTLHFRNDAAQYPLTLRTVTPRINTKARNQEVRLSFTDSKALPGSAGRLQWQSEQAHLPADMLVQRDGQTGVFILQENTAHFVAIDTAHIGYPAPAESLPGNAQIIVDGRLGLADGDAVSVINN
jgi:RND family efflux transporter MFP subunit